MSLPHSPRWRSAVGIAAAFGLALGAAARPTPARAIDGPDLELDVPRMAKSVTITTGVYHKPGRAPSLDATVPISGACVLDKDEDCVGGPGIRKLLRFDVLVHNVGNQDLVIGDPKDRPDVFVFSDCHRHYHFRGAALYELLDENNNNVRTGRKQGFCIEDTIPSTNPAPSPKKYDCKNQGIQVGWADFYPSILDCQWIDITDIPPGSYKLHVSWNPKHLIPETTLDNNQGTVEVTIPAPTDAPPVVESISAPSAVTRADAGKRMQVSWHASDDHKIVTQEVWLSLDDGVNYQEMVGDLPGDQTSFMLQVPANASSDAARVKIVARDESVQRGERVSEAFHINPRQVRLPLLGKSIGGAP